MYKNYKLEVYMHSRLCMHEHFDLIINSFKYKCETFQVLIHPFFKNVVSAKCDSWVMDLTTFKMNDSTHVQMLIVQKMQKKIINSFRYKCEH
jgi:hypothetical protein